MLFSESKNAINYTALDFFFSETYVHKSLKYFKVQTQQSKYHLVLWIRVFIKVLKNQFEIYMYVYHLDVLKCNGDLFSWLQGDVYKTRGGGQSVQFTEIETLKQESPTR